MGKKLEHPQQVAKSVKKHDKQVLDTLSTEATHVFGKDTLFIHDYLAQVMTDHFLDYRSANLQAAFLKIAIGVKKRAALTAPSAAIIATKKESDYYDPLLREAKMNAEGDSLNDRLLKALGLEDNSAAPSAGVGREEAANVAAKEYAKQPKTRTPISLKPGEFNSDYKQGFLAGADWQSRSASQPGVGTDNLRASIAEVLKEGDGYWKTCSGCHESEDGHDVGDYPFSETFQCKLGGGCHECGGIGAVWEYYPVETADTDESPSPPPDGLQGLVEALNQIAQMSDPGSHELAVIDMKQIACKALTAYKNANPC